MSCLHVFGPPGLSDGECAPCLLGSVEDHVDPNVHNDADGLTWLSGPGDDNRHPWDRIVEPEQPHSQHSESSRPSIAEDVAGEQSQPFDSVTPVAAEVVS